jgi:SAM-dependent methyltransferase
MKSEVSLTFKDDFRDLVSPARDKNRLRYNWYTFKHSFSKELVDKLLEEFDINTGYVLDPFCGGGTTLLACKERGVNAIGYDIMPFAVFISNVKTSHFNSSRLGQDLNSFKIAETNEQLPNIQIVDKAFTPSVKKAVLGIRAWINSLPKRRSREFFLLALFNTIDQVSRAVKSGGFLRLVDKRTTHDKTVKIFLRVANKMIQDVKTSPLNSDAKTRAFIGDARELPTKQLYDAVITSPPYPNRHDYTRVYALELLVAFVNSNQELKQLRYRTLRSHVEARPRFPVNGYVFPKLLKEKLSRLKSKNLNNSQVLPMLRGYFEDMYLVLKKINACLKKDGKILMVVSNVRYGGVAIPVDRILGEIGVQTGLKLDAIWVVRKRGNSSQQMKRYSRQPNRESVIIWEKPN